MFDLATRRKINKGFSDGFTRAVEIVATPVLLGFIGALVDGWLDTRQQPTAYEAQRSELRDPRAQ